MQVGMYTEEDPNGSERDVQPDLGSLPINMENLFCGISYANAKSALKVWAFFFLLAAGARQRRAILLRSFIP